MSTYSKIADGLRLIGITGCTNDIVNSWLKGLGMSGTTPDMLFSYLRSIGLTGSLSDMLSAYIFSATGEKVLIDLSPTSNGFYSLGTPITFAGDFEIEVDFLTSSPKTIISGTLESANTIIIDVAGSKLRTFAYVGTSFTGQIQSSINVDDGKLHTAKLKYIGNTASLYLNNILVDSTTWNLNGSQEIKFFGKREARGTFSGIVSNVKLTDLTTPANSLPFKIDKLTDNFELPVNNVFGSQIWTNPASTIQSPWVYDSNGGYSIDGSQASSVVLAEDILTNETVVEVTFTVSNYVAGTIRAIAGGGATGNVGNLISSNGTFKQILVTNPSTGTNMNFQANGSFEGTISNITIRTATNVLTYQNIGTGTDVRDTYTLIDDDYIGSELVINGDFATDSDWSITGESNISAGRANIYSSAGANTFIRQDAVMLDGLQYILEYEIISANSGDFKISSVSNSALSKEIGINTLVFNALGTSILLQRNAVELTDIVINNISIKRYIEVV